jgi:hypothetical protein
METTSYLCFSPLFVVSYRIRPGIPGFQVKFFSKCRCLLTVCEMNQHAPLSAGRGHFFTEKNTKVSPLGFATGLSRCTLFESN